MPPDTAKPRDTDTDTRSDHRPGPKVMNDNLMNDDLMNDDLMNDDLMNDDLMNDDVVIDDVMIDVAGAKKHFGASVALDDVSLRVERHQTVVLLGPSGCGKTTLLRSIAGLERLDEGSVIIDGAAMTTRGAHVPPERRRIGLVFQDWALFPHMSVADNVAYGLGRDIDRSTRVAEVLDMVGLAGVSDRMPGTLSGGQQQRVALARSLAPRPQALLLDEPFSNLDSGLRTEVRTEVHALLTELGITTVFVTHDQTEAFVLGDKVAVMRDGVIEQFAAPSQVYRRPANPWIATFVGQANLFAAVGRGETATTPIGDVPLERPASGPITVLVRPEDLQVQPAGSPTASAGRSGETSANCVMGTVELVEYHGHDHMVYVSIDTNASDTANDSHTGSDCDTVEVKTRLVGVPTLRRGDRVTLSVSRPATAFDHSQQPALS